MLNSSVYEFYFKTFGKKLGYDLYEYYPSNLMKLYIPPIIFSKLYSFEEQLYDYFQLTDREIKFIENNINIRITWFVKNKVTSIVNCEL